MGGTTGDGESAADIRASDAERDATIERLSTATGDGRLTLEEFSQRMELATSARTRGELDRLVADLPAGAAGTGTAVAAGAPAPPSWHVSPIGGLRVSGPWRMDRHVIAVSIVGRTRLDLSEAQLAAPEVTLTKVSVVGRTRIIVPRGSGSRHRGSAWSAAPGSKAGQSRAPARQPSISARSRWSAGSESTAAGGLRDHAGTGAPAGGHGGPGSPRSWRASPPLTAPPDREGQRRPRP
jgi:hypothetical protein